MSDIDEGDREGDNAYSGKTPTQEIYDLMSEIADKLHDAPKAPPGFSWGLIRGIQALALIVGDQQATIKNLQERLETYMQRSAPALSAARMHVPIGGGGSWSWRQQQDRKARERQEKLEAYKAKLAARTPEQVKLDNEMFESLFKPDGAFSFGSGGDHSTQLSEKPVKRKRSKKTTKRK
jgi:hypothetical protein